MGLPTDSHHRFSAYPLLDRFDLNPRRAPFSRPRCFEKSRLRSACHLFLLFYFCGKHGADRCGQRALFLPLGKEHASCQHLLVPVYQQRPLGSSSFPIHNRLQVASFGSEHRRNGHSDRFSCKPYLLPRIRFSQSRQGRLIPCKIFGIQLFVRYCADPALHGNFIKNKKDAHSHGLYVFLEITPPAAYCALFASSDWEKHRNSL